MKSIKWMGLLGAAILPGILSAGTIGLGNSASALNFSSPDLTLGSCASNVCTITGGGSLSGAPVAWSVVTTLSGGTPIQWSGSGPTFPLNQEGASIVFNFSDSPGPDTLAGTVSLISETGSTTPSDATDIDGTITFTSVNLVSTALKTYLLANYGPLPTVGSTALLDLNVSCNTGSQVQCVQLTDPTSTSASASITSQSTAPEPGTMMLLGCGLAAIAFRKKAMRLSARACPSAQK